jgi:hypothetical protein
VVSRTYRALLLAAALGLPATRASAEEAVPPQPAPDSAASPAASEAAPEAASEASDAATGSSAAEAQPSAPSDMRPVATAAADTLGPWRERIESTNLAKASDKVGFAGFIINRAFDNQYSEIPRDRSVDAAGTKLDAELTLKMAVNANSFMRVTTMLSFGYDFSGHFLNNKADRHLQTLDVAGIPLVDTIRSDKTRAPYVQDAQREGAGVFEDMMASIEIKTDPVDANLRAGSALWIEGSPFTLWKRDPRPRLAWYYEGYEPELASMQYYNQKFFYRRNDLGRLSWPKKPFGGIELDAYRMPGGTGLQFAFAQPANMIPTAKDGSMTSHLGDAEGLSSFDNLGEMYYGRLTKSKVYKDLTLGGNLLWIELPLDMINQKVFGPNLPQGFVYQFQNINQQPFFAQPRVFTLDARGNLSSSLFIHADFALAMDDTVKYLPFDRNPATPAMDTVYDGRSKVERASSTPVPAFYLKVNSGKGLPYEAEAFFAGKGFWSPYALTEHPLPLGRDEMKLGSGAFSYQPNLVGASVKVSPKVSNGFLNFTIGQHVQPEKGRNMIAFQHTLTGREVWTASNSWSRTDPSRYLDEGAPFGNPKYAGRVGEHGPNRNMLHKGRQTGGLRGGDLELWEEFAAYDSKEQAELGNAPESQKWATSLAADWGYYLNPLFGYEKPILVNLYGMVNSIGTDLTGVANNDKTLLWNALARLEPGIAVTDNLLIIGTVGVETFKSDKAWRNILANENSTTRPWFDAEGKAVSYNNINYYEPVVASTPGGQNALPFVVAEHSPIDYLLMAYGIGFDWDFSQRAGMHFRYKYATHADKNLPSNDWSGSFLFGEMKIWF